MDNRQIRLDQIVHSALARSDNAAEVRRLVPAAWPILEVEHTIKIRIEEEIGVVERYMIEALARFGPMDAEKLAKFLGLEVFVIEAVAGNLQRFSDTVSNVDGVYKVPSDALERLEQQKWSRSVETTETFFVDGIGGRLLPVRLSKAYRSKWLRLDLTKDSSQINDLANNEIRDLCWLASTGCKGSQALEEAIRGGDVERREELGIPAGAFGVVPDNSIIRHERWLLALLEVNQDGCVAVRPAFMPDWELANVGAEHRLALGDALRRGGESVAVLLNPDSDKIVSIDVKRKWKPFIDYSANDGDFVVKLKNPSSLQFWSYEEKPDDDGGVTEDEAPEESGGSIPPCLRNVLRFPYWWHSLRFAVRRVVPGDKVTAGSMLLLRGMEELRRVASRAETEEIDLTSWWDDFQEKTTRDWPSEFSDCRVAMKVMLFEASRSPDGQVVEMVSEYL